MAKLHAYICFLTKHIRVDVYNLPAAIFILCVQPDAGSPKLSKKTHRGLPTLTPYLQLARVPDIAQVTVCGALARNKRWGRGRGGAGRKAWCYHKYSLKL